MRSIALAPAVAEDGSEMARPAARHSISMRQPWPTIARPPITQSMGMKTSLPQLGPLGNAAPEGRCRRPMCTPGCVVGISATVMPRFSPLPRMFSGSNRRKARPSSVALGPSVM